jgi:hypothetical protein
VGCDHPMSFPKDQRQKRVRRAALDTPHPNPPPQGGEGTRRWEDETPARAFSHHVWHFEALAVLAGEHRVGFLVVLEVLGGRVEG